MHYMRYSSSITVDTVITVYVVYTLYSLQNMQYIQITVAAAACRCVSLCVVVCRCVVGSFRVVVSLCRYEMCRCVVSYPPLPGAGEGEFEGLNVSE